MREKNLGERAEIFWAMNYGFEKIEKYFRFKDIAHTHIHREMVKNEDIRGGMGDITFNMNSNWFLDLAEGMGWSLKTEYFDCSPDLLARCATYDEYSFMKTTEDTIATFFNAYNFTTETETTLDIAIWNYLEAHDDTWFSMFKNFFVYTSDADAILAFWEHFWNAKVGTIIVAENEPVSICVNVEKTHKTKNGYMIGVKSALDRSRCRQLWNDWFVDAFVVLVADETITHAEVEAYRVETEARAGLRGRFSEERTWVDDVIDAMLAAKERGDKDFTLNLPPDVAKGLIEKSKKGGEKAGTTTAKGKTSMSLDSAMDAFSKVADILGMEKKDAEAGSSS